MKKNISAMFLYCIVFLSNMSFAGIKFGNLNINNDNTALYTVTSNIAGSASYSTLFSYTLKGEQSIDKDNLPDILTCYPESMSSISSGNMVQVRNRYGTALYDFRKDTLQWIARTAIIPDKSFSLSPILTSPDGKWCVFFRKNGSSTGELIIQNSESKKYVVLNREAEFSYSEIPVKWSDDSKNFIYEKNNFLYFCNPENMFKGIQLEEKYRCIGKGKINCIQWTGTNTLAYIDSDVVYLIDSRDFSSLGLYSNFYFSGKIIGRLLEEFDSATMEFKINSAATQMLIIKNSNFVSYYEFNLENPGDYVTLLNYKSYTGVFDGSFKISVFWQKNSKPVIWTDFISDAGKRNSSVYIFTESNEMKKILNVENSTSDIAVTNDGKYFAFSAGESVYVYSLSPWERVAEIKGERVTSLCWKNAYELCIGGEQTVKLYNIFAKSERVLFLSSCTSATWDKISGKIIAQTKNCSDYFMYNEKQNVWNKVQLVSPEDIQVQNQDYRIYVAQSKNARFENGIYVRNFAGKSNNFALYKETLQKSPKKKRIALVFDLLDRADGVCSIIALCEKYQIRSTFFINGEFIRRYPKEVKKIASSGAEVGSMFYACIDLTEKDFNVNEDYIRRGLARNEDEYYECTKKELSLLWHAPFYKSNKMIKDAASLSGYSYIDFPTETDSIGSKAGKAIESQIIPITVGIKSDSDKKKFYNKLELLINSLLDADYEIVPVSEL